MSAKYPMPATCPVCRERLEVTGLACPGCGTRLEGRFLPNEFATLPPEQLEFLRLFVKARGNLKEVERVLGVSYPTVRARLEQLLRVLGYEAAPDLSQARQAVLDALERGEITPEEAAARLRALGQR